MHENTERTLLRDCLAIRIPSGETFTLSAGTRVFITQALGGSFTIATDLGLARITDENADALGLEPTAQNAAAAVPEGEAPAVEEKAVWDQLRTCYDPEIPVNIVDLGLVYDTRIERRDDGKHVVGIKMTLTAPGCGMGVAITADAEDKLRAIDSVADASVEIVWEPAWNPRMISPEGRRILGID